MNMFCESKNKQEELESIVLNEIRKGNKKHPITGKKLCNNVNLNFRLVKELITKLRDEYPIVAKETNGGGYWLAEDKEDILDYVKMIEKRKKGYEETIVKMLKFI